MRDLVLTHQSKNVKFFTFSGFFRSSTVKQKRLASRPKAPSLHPTSVKPLGILGGGQLARMLALKAHELGVNVAIFSERADDPAAQVGRLWAQGSLKDEGALRTFLAGCSLVTFESEFLDAHLLSELSRETGVAILPRPQDMALIQDRLTQKELLLKNRLPTARFHTVSTPDEAKFALADLGGRAVFKKRRFGYDGYGTFIVRSEKELVAFLPELKSNPHGFIAEEFIAFRRELAVMVVRSARGATVRLPFVESFQENARCLWVKGPLKESAQLRGLGAKLEKFLRAISYAGAMGIELFDTEKGLMVNELAPRVHNSGHYSLDALSVDQFSLHIKAVLGQDLGKPRPLDKGFAMMNLLGSSGDAPSWRLPGDVKLHWYGKGENRKGRKMGHINALAPTPEMALALVKKNRARFDI